MSDRILVGTRKGLFAVERGAGGWSVADAAFVGDNVSMLHHDRRDVGTTYAALDHGHFGAKMHRASHGIADWEECGTPTYPPMPEGHEEPPNPVTGKAVEWSLKKVWAFASGGPDEDVLWCGSIPGGLFRSRDRGGSWELVESLWNHPSRLKWFGGGTDLPGLHSICVDPRDARRVLVGVSCGGVWFTGDGGESWTCRADGMRAAYMPPEQAFEPNVQDPHCVVQCRAAPDHLWSQHHNGIFRSTDGAASWREIEEVRPSAFGFAVAVHPEDPETAWFVPALKDEKRVPVDGQVVVTRTRDGGASFDVLTEGLPQRHAYDLVFRHALDIDESGRRLAFGSTTGSLWVTEDQGDSWTEVSSHLPPVHCVRFG